MYRQTISLWGGPCIGGRGVNGGGSLVVSDVETACTARWSSRGPVRVVNEEPAVPLGDVEDETDERLQEHPVHG